VLGWYRKDLRLTSVVFGAMIHILRHFGTAADSDSENTAIGERDEGKREGHSGTSMLDHKSCACGRAGYTRLRQLRFHGRDEKGTVEVNGLFMAFDDDGCKGVIRHWTFYYSRPTCSASFCKTLHCPADRVGDVKCPGHWIRSFLRTP
jgi:hypothetical protein